MNDEKLLPPSSGESAARGSIGMKLDGTMNAFTAAIVLASLDDEQLKAYEDHRAQLTGLRNKILTGKATQEEFELMCDYLRQVSP